MSFAEELTPSADNFELFPPTLRTDLILPPCTWDDMNINICTRTAEQELIIVEIYLGYTLAMKHRERIERILKFDESLFDTNDQVYNIALASIDDQSVYNDHLLERLEVYEEKASKCRRRAAIQGVAIGAGSLAVGIGVGILIGLIAGAN